MSNVRKTTAEILKENVKKPEKSQVFDQDYLAKIEKSLEQWKKDTVKPDDLKNWSVVPLTVLGSEIPREMIYTPLSIANTDYAEEVGNPGEAPFTRGIHSNMYRGRTFTQRQLVGFGGPEDTNARIKYLLNHGATGINLLFDMPSIQMYDCDDPMSQGSVGSCGCNINHVKDWEMLYDGIDIAKESSSIVTHYPSNTAVLFPMYLVMAERRGVSWDQLKGSSQNDMTLEELVRNSSEYIPPKDCFRIECDNIEFIRKNVPKWNFITVNGYNLREFGTSGVTEMAVAAAHGMAILDEMVRRGYEVDWVAERLAFFWSGGMDFFEEVARLRAMRRLWYRILKYKYNAKKDRSTLMRCHLQTSGISLVREEPYNNAIRSAFEALAAVLGGVQSLHVDSYDEAIAVPSEEASLLSLRTQQIIEHETGVTSVVDPLGGSYYIEALTNQMEEKILAEITEIENQGGYVEAVANGYLSRKIYNYMYKEQTRIETGEIKIVGHNYQKSGEGETFEAFRYPEDCEAKQLQRLKEHRQNRDNAKVEQALDELRVACREGKNVMEYTVNCARAGCTIGEQWKVFKEVFGLWKRPSVF
ncbi:acyl-CoA mutase large subunit family protein [Sporomusa sphaeroides DSM 2875]|uniref:acyl-CoA mutase large subunit family protein n=1 Tax=Sporomusa sphaeroides TaxID=47679 RepID=UPI00202FDA72|nr:acyl-CoA mutase large subunit family protein [Sporomusa sphaeroides]MCM0759492.1 acyl-CoA mutase large subunit family protein [Sporomusa sphaeroides DSM 2875]